MNDLSDRTATAPDDDSGFDPHAAAALLDDTDRRVRHQLDPRGGAWMTLFGALVVVVAYGAIWLSVHDQHPYAGPSLGVIGLVYGLVLVCAIVAGVTRKRAIAGVSGRSRHDELVQALAFLPALIGVYTFDGALKHDGFSNAIVYGVFDAAGPWLVAGAVLATWSAAREDWWRCGLGIAILVAGVGAAFSGANAVWGVLAVCGFGGAMVNLALHAVVSRRA